MATNLAGRYLTSVNDRPGWIDHYVVVLGLQLVALWGVWRWMGNRLLESDGAFWEILPLLSLTFFAWMSTPIEGSRHRSNALILATFALVLYAVASLAAPPMLRAGFAMLSIGFVISRWRFGTAFHPGVFTLLILCLPVIDSLNFYLGYPMRAIIGEVTATLLNMQGLLVVREGVNLHFGDTIIVIDAPCSGIKMLWFSVLLATNLSFLLKLVPKVLPVVLALAFVATLLGNIARASMLFYLESGLFDAPSWMHSAVGVAAFLMTSIAIAAMVKGLEARWAK